MNHPAEWSKPIVGFGLLLVLFAGCTEESKHSGPQPRPSVATRHGDWKIPEFKTASQQLNYAKSLLTDPGEKRAALKALIERFPDNRPIVGEARLELAYMRLGADYRLADPAACRRALADYESTARAFSDVPSVVTKAYWYMGWIYADLLGDKEKGIAIYSILAEKYPGHSFSRISPVPWLNLIFPNPRKKPYTADDKHSHSWAGLALYEIVRYTRDERDRMAAFEKLWEEHRDNLATGYALREILKRSGQPEKMARWVKDYIRLNRVNPELNRDLTYYLASGTEASGNRMP